MNEYVEAYTGPRGGGKSAAMAYAIYTKYMRKGIPVYSNMPVRVKEKSGRVYETMDLDTADMMSLDKKLMNCCIAIDEIGRWVNARRSTTDNNLVFDYIMQQIRKLRLSVLFSVQQLNWIDVRLRFQTDLEFECQDWYFKNRRVQKGTVILIDVRDLSGKASGTSYYKTGRIWRHMTLHAKPIWNWYNSYQTQDINEVNPFEFENKKQPMVNDEVWSPIVENVLNSYINRGEFDFRTKDFWEEVGNVSGQDVDRIKRRLAINYMGKVDRQQRGDGWHYVLPKDILQNV